MKLVVLMNLLPNLPVPRKLAGKRAMAKEIEVREIEDVDLIPLDKKKVQKPAHTVMLQVIVSLPAGKNIMRNHQNLRKGNSKKRHIAAKI